MEALTVVCSLWKGWQPIYEAKHVNALRRMVEKYLPGARFVCFTKEPEGVDAETRPLPVGPRLQRLGHRDCFRRMWFFSREFAELFPGRILNVDLDALILRDMWPMITDHDFRIAKANCCPYNGGFWLHRTGTRPQVWENLSKTNVNIMNRDRKCRRWVGSDQKWLAYTIPGEATYDKEDGMAYASGVVAHPPGPRREKYVASSTVRAARILFFPGSPGVKPWSDHAKKNCPEIYDRYMSFYDA